tara:strand:- start:77 stop:295 length:219 start_codon:yes stop_codon:yes gene_type:complete
MVVPVLFIIVFVVVAIVHKRGAATRGCRWRADRSRDKGTLHFYHCAACGAEAYTATEGPPRDCKADAGPPPL